MDISFDPVKRKRTLLERELDFIDAVEVFEGSEFTRVDSRSDYGEIRCVTYGLLKGRVICVVWTQRGETRHIISMRKANDREQKRYYRALD